MSFMKVPAQFSTTYKILLSLLGTIQLQTEVYSFLGNMLVFSHSSFAYKNCYCNEISISSLALTSSKLFSLVSWH